MCVCVGVCGEGVCVYVGTVLLSECLQGGRVIQYMWSVVRCRYITQFFFFRIAVLLLLKCLLRLVLDPNTDGLLDPQ